MNRASRSIGIAAALSVWTLQVSFAQQPAFRATTDLVLLDVVVLDRERRPVTGLTAADFTVADEGVEQPIQTFVAVEATRQAAGSTPAVGASTSAGGRLPAAPGRFVAIVLDRTIPAGASTVAARTVARSAIEALAADDAAAVVRTSGFADGASAEFTTDRSQLLDAIEGPFTGMTTPLEMQPGDGGGGLVRRAPDPFESIDCHCGVCTLASIERIADALAASAGQKLVIFIGSDIALQADPARDPAECIQPIRDAREATLRALDRANVTVHAIDPSGLETLARGADAFPLDRRDPPGRTLERQGNLAVLPDYTGGRTVLSSNAPEALVHEIFAETGSYYLIGVARAGGGDADGRRRVVVRVNEPDATVRSRSWYYAAPARTGIVEPSQDASTDAVSGADAAPVKAVALPDPEDRGAAAWRALVSLYAQGQTVEAVAHVATWTHDDLNDVLASISDIPMPERVAVVRQALLLHTAVGIAERRGGGDMPESSEGSSALFFDGRQVGVASPSSHWILARRLIERLPRGPERTATAQTFYRATGALLAWWASHIELDAHLEAARQSVPDDPYLSLYEGARHHLYAHPRAAAALAEQRREIALGPRDRRRGLPPLPSIDAARRTAEQAFREALQGAPDLVEARVRLAHTLLDRDRADEAVAMLASVDITSQPGPLAYYAYVVQGRALRRLDRLDEAARDLTAAADLFPRAQTPRLALSELALSTGDRAGARLQLGILAARRTDDDDPWVWLPRWHANAQADLERMYREFAP